MSRFGDEYEEPFPNAYWLWEHSLTRAMSSPRGQQALRDLEAALLALPEPKLISGALAMEGQVCAVGAFALHKGIRAGRSREEVLAELERRIPAGCDNCWHAAEQHDEDGCHGTHTTRPCECTSLKLRPDWNGDGYLETIEVGKECGLAMTLANSFSYQNDEGPYQETPEERYERLLAWTRARIMDEVAA